MIEEKFVSGQSFIHKLDPRTRIIAVTILSFAAALCNSIYTALSYLLISIVLTGLAKLNAKDVVNRLKPAFWFIAMIWILLPVTFDGEAIYIFYGLKITSSGILMCCEITIKSISILLFFTSLIATMNVTALGNALHRLYVPDKMIFLLLMSYRYIAVIEDEYKRLLRAAKFRGFRPKTNIHSYKTFAYLAGMLFVRASLRAQRVHQAMLCRGFNQKFYSLDVYKANGFNLIFLISVFVMGLSLFILEIIWI